MTAFTPNGHGEAQFAASDQLDLPAPPSLIRQADPIPDTPRKFMFRQQIIPLDGGRTLLRLHQPLTLLMNQRTMEFDVEGWNIHMRCAQVDEVPRQIARRFLTLFSKADAGAITPAERIEWLGILDRVDFTQFSVERAAPHYVEGTLQRKLPAVVQWHDGAVEQIPPSLASAFFPLDPGDRFSAFVKLGKDNHALHIERVCLLPESAAA